MEKEQRFVSLTIENVMGVKAARIERKGAVTTIGGKNRQGKTSVIKTVWMILGGASSTPGEPLRDGARKGGGLLELTDYLCELKLTNKSRPQISVKSKEGAIIPAPATFLKSLTAGKSFNPISFYAEKPEKQLEILRSLVGLDTTEIDQERETKYAQRTNVNRKCKELQARLDNTPRHEGAPGSETTAAELLAELKRRQTHNAEVREQREDLFALRKEANTVKTNISMIEENLTKQRERFAEMSYRGKELSACVHDATELDEEEIAHQVDDLEQINRKVRENLAHAGLACEFEEACTESEALTHQVNSLDERKEAAIEAAAFPVEGLSFGDGCVMYNGRSLADACGLERMRVSLGIGMALNPGLRLLAVDEGERLDEDEHAALATLAEKQGCDLLIARVSTGPECQIILEDGEIKS